MSDERPIEKLRDYAGYSEEIPTRAERLRRRLGDGLSTMSPRSRGKKMQSWHLTAGLAAAATLAAWLIPGLPFLSATVSPDEPVLIESILSIPPPTQEGNLTFTGGLDQTTLLQGVDSERFLVVSFQAPEVAAVHRQPVHLAVVVDASGSMMGDRKIDYARAAVKELVSQLSPEDSFSLIGFDEQATVHVPLQAVGSGSRLYPIINAMEPGGGTRLSAGLQEGLVQLHDAPEAGVRRVVLLSDGLSGEGPDVLAALAGSRLQQGTTVSAMGLGLDFDDDLLIAISDAGGGRYRYVNDPGALSSMFADELDRLTRVASRDVSLEVELAEGVEILDVYGYEDYDGEILSSGYRAFIGDMHSGEQRKVVARIRVPVERIGQHEIARVVVHHAEPGESHRYTNQGIISALITDDPVLSAASVNPDLGALAASAFTGATLEKGMRRWKAGDVEAAEQVFAQGRDRLQDMGGRYGTDGVEGFMSTLEDREMAFDGLAPGSDEARELNQEVMLEALDAAY